MTAIDAPAPAGRTSDTAQAAAAAGLWARSARLPGPGEPELAAWLERCRRAARRHRLDPQTSAALDSGVPGWRRTREERWNAHLAALAAASVPSPFLRSWLGAQRRALAAGTLAGHRRTALDRALGDWSAAAPAPSWDDRAADIIDFVDLHSRLPRAAGLDDEGSLYRWLGVQRAAARNGKLTSGRMALLDKAAPGWLPESEGRDFHWQVRARALSAFVAGHRRWPLPSVPQEAPLAAWSRTQRTSHLAGRLNETRTAALAAVPGWPGAVTAKGGIIDA